MAFKKGLAGTPARSVRNEQRRQDDKRRMAFRRAIEDFREAQALQAELGDYPELAGQTLATLPRPAV